MDRHLHLYPYAGTLHKVRDVNSVLSHLEHAPRLVTVGTGRLGKRYLHAPFRSFFCETKNHSPLYSMTYYIYLTS